MMVDIEKTIKELQKYYDKDWIDERSEGLKAVRKRKSVLCDALYLLMNQSVYGLKEREDSLEESIVKFINAEGEC